MIQTTDFLILLGGFLLSLSVFSLILGDNWLFRLSASVFAGVLSAYVCILIVKKVFLPRILDPLLDPAAGWESKAVLLAVLAGAFFLFIKIFLKAPAGGNLTLSILLCIMAAVTIAGIADGTILGLYRSLIENFQASANSSGGTLHWFETGIILIGTITSLIHMQHYQIKKQDQPETGKKGFSGLLSAIGEIFIGVALGSIFAGSFIASAVILVEQLSRLLNAGQTLFQWMK